MAEETITVIGYASQDLNHDTPLGVVKGLRGIGFESRICQCGEEKYLVQSGEYLDGWNERHFVIREIKKVEQIKEDSNRVADMTLSDAVPPAVRESLSSFFKKRCLAKNAIFHGLSLG